MKNSLITYLLGFFFLISCFKANSALLADLDTSVCLQIEGHIVNAGDGYDQCCVIELLCANTVVKTIELKDGKKKFKFYLKKNLNYAIRISKKDHITTVVCIDTKMHKAPHGMKYFLFETKMKETYNEANSQIDYPIAIIYYDGTKDNFVHDKDFTDKMKKELALR